MAVLFARIPDERLAVLIGTGGRTKREIERATGTSIEIDPDDQEVRIDSPDGGDPIGAIRAREIVVAIGRGFSPERASRLLREDTYLAVIDIKFVSGKRRRSALWRIRSRVIGAGGRARERIEELSGCSASVYGSTVALIGTGRQLERARQAVELLLKGSEHSTVFHQLARQRREDARSDALGLGLEEADEA